MKRLNTNTYGLIIGLTDMNVHSRVLDLTLRVTVCKLARPCVAPCYPAVGISIPKLFLLPPHHCKSLPGITGKKLGYYLILVNYLIGNINIT